jgi:hypothetical protein
VDGRVIRFDVVDDALSKANQAAEVRLATQWMRSSAEREAAIEVLAKQREHAEWLERFNRERLARQNERHDSADMDESAERLAWRLQNQHRPNFDPTAWKPGAK